MIPIPVDLAALLFIGFGVFMTVGSVVKFVTYLFGSHKAEAEWRATVHHYLDKYFGYNPSQTALALLMGVGFSILGYLVYFDLLYPLLFYLFSPAQLPLTIVALIVLAFVLYFLLSVLKEKAAPVFVFDSEGWKYAKSISILEITFLLARACNRQMI